jgi:hypothetical protein
MIRDDGVDYTWLFALNYGAAHGLAFGRDLVWTNGPLGVLTFPQNIGANLPHALIYQMLVWILLAGIFGYAVFRAGIPLRRLALFAAGLGMATPLFWFNRNQETLLFAAALTLLVLVRFHGGRLRYLTALAILGIIPLIKLSIAIPAALAVAGFLVDRTRELRWKVWPQALQAILIPPAFTAAGLWFTLPSRDALRLFLQSNLDIVSGYSTAMSDVGSTWELVAAFVTLAAFTLFLWLAVPRPFGRFYGWLLLFPLVFGIKHGFARQDDHIVNFFCLVALALALLAMQVDFAGWRSYGVLAVMIAMPLICLPSLVSYKNLLADVSGLRAIRGMWLASRSLISGPDPAKEKTLMGALAPRPSMDPEIRAIVKDAPVAFLSLNYSAAYFDGLNLQIYPVVQRYSAYTPYLDGLNAEWVRNRGPRFLVFDGLTIGGRHPWAETPAMWAEVYRNYNTRLLTAANLLLERRSKPRFTRFEVVRRFPVSMPGELDLASADHDGFWALNCGLSTFGSLNKLLLRVPLVSMTVLTDDRHSYWYRSITEVLTAPVPAAWLPGSLPEFAAALQPDSIPSGHIRKLIFGSYGAGFYQPPCQAEFLQAK